MFNKAGIAMINENNKVRIPFAPLISRSTLPILATLTYKKQYIIYIFGKGPVCFVLGCVKLYSGVEIFNLTKP